MKPVSAVRLLDEIERVLAEEKLEPAAPVSALLDVMEKRIITHARATANRSKHKPNPDQGMIALDEETA